MKKPKPENKKKKTTANRGEKAGREKEKKVAGKRKAAGSDRAERERREKEKKMEEREGEVNTLDEKIKYECIRGRENEKYVFLHFYG